MNKLKTKITTKDNIHKIEIYKGGKFVDSIVRFTNVCLVCKKEVFGSYDLGKDFICPHCVEKLKSILKIKEQERVEIVAAASKTLLTKTTEHNKKGSRERKAGAVTYLSAINYNPRIKLNDYVSYRNLMRNPVNETVATTLVDLVNKGTNTPNKIVKVLKEYSPESIYTYLHCMARAGMLVCVNPNKTVGNYNRMFKIHKNLVYTTIE